VNAGEVRNAGSVGRHYEASDYKRIYGPTAQFDSQTIDNTAVLVKHTYYGDTDFNGVVNFDDYGRTDSGFNNPTGPQS
jgi:hypothetical protein